MRKKFRKDDEDDMDEEGGTKKNKGRGTDDFSRYIFNIDSYLRVVLMIFCWIDFKISDIDDWVDSDDDDDNDSDDDDAEKKESKKKKSTFCS